MSKWTGFGSRAGLLCLLLGVMFDSPAFADDPRETSISPAYIVSAMISTGTCSIAITPTSPPQVIALDTDMASGSVQGETEVRVKATDCQGAGAADKTPSVKVDGVTYDVAEPGSAGTFTPGKYLFYNTGSTVQWAGFVLSKTRPGAQAWDESAYVKSNDIISLGQQGETCDGVAGCETTFWTGLSCGGLADCQNHFGGGNNIGVLKASINFTFLYN